MEFITTIVGSVVGEIGKSLVGPIKRHTGYLIHYHRNITNLEDERKKLDDKRAEAVLFVQDAEKKVQVPVPGVPRWKEAADVLNQNVSEFLEKETPGASNRCWNPWSRYSSSRKAFKMMENIKKKIQDAPAFGSVAYDAPTPSLGSTFLLEGVKDFESRRSVINDVWEALKNDDLKMIGICGMGGVGKTTMVKNIVKRVEMENFFGTVVMIEISRKPNSTIQKEISERLRLYIREKTLAGRAGKLLQWFNMNHDKKILLILDDVWEEVDFEAIGLPFEGNNKGCKIMLTSRNHDVCSKIGCQKNFLIDILSKDEARDLFKEAAGSSIDSNMLDIASEIVDECGGLPLAIVTVAKALKNKSRDIWDDALLQLKKSNMEGILGMKKVHSKLELSFDLLEREEAKSCFLLCCLFPQDYNVPVKDLVSYGMGIGLFRNVQNVDQARNRVSALVDELKEKFLLLDGDSDKYESVKMHDLLHDVAISIASREKYGYMVSFDAETKKWPEETERYKDCKAISLVRRRVKRHPVDLECPKLQLLRLEFGYDSQSLPKHFFEGMKELRVIFLDAPSLPQSLDVFKKLRALHLHNLESGEISSIGFLITLEILEISTDSFEELPVEIGLLKNLKVLNLREMKSLRYIPFGVLSKLSILEELYVNKSFKNWESAKNGKINASLKELESHPITTLHIGILDLSVLPKASVIRNLKRFAIFIYRKTLYTFKEKDSVNELYIVGGTDVVLASGICALLTKTEALWLTMPNFKKSLLELEYEGFSVDTTMKVIPCFNNLKYITLDTCREMKYVFPMSIARGLKQLQSIEVSLCYKMEGIFYGKEGENEKILSEDDDVKFPKLISLKLRYLEKLIGFWVEEDNAAIRHLSHQSGDDATKSMICNKVTSDIPETSSASHMIERGKIGNTELQHVSSHSIAILFSYCVQLSNLQELYLSRCKLLQVVFPPSVAGQLKMLKSLKVDGCAEIEYIVGGRQEERNDDTRTNKLVFPMLTSLHLTDLQMLVAFSPDSDTSFEWPLLNYLRIDRCPKMKTFCPTVESPLLTRNKSDAIVSSQEPGEVKDEPSHIYNQAETYSLFSSRSTEGMQNLRTLSVVKFLSHETQVMFSFQECHCDKMLNNLEELVIVESPNLEHVWLKISLEISAFQNLKKLRVENCSHLKYLFSPLVAKLLVKLANITLKFCDLLEALVAEEELDEEARRDKIIFPQLRSLQLVSLGNLKGFSIDKSVTIELPVLEDLTFECCKRLKTFSYGSVILPKLKKIEIDGRYHQIKEDLNATLQETCNDKDMDSEASDEAGATSE